ncbi:hypothetical protein GCM10010377_79210 [Streptomyces viridiviolaceus]|uniref:Yip1 family protein n=1 Tax=Streptomyces viridiviolaceus TaxID=68282 RepID=A0ABW2E7F0_9ACTN|nr:Yip1 family protein [Streptomyces viridiviolaceus]GHB77038.1 hypothetical protein GCM10010377_79210 [Streptomyces viridiviolaceus]
MSIRPWVVVEAPDGRGLRRVTVGGENAGSAWSLRELRRMLDRLGYPDVDVEDAASVCWRGGDSGTWPDRAWRRYATIVLMTVGLLASAVLNGVIGWPDASGALTFAQRITGALLVLSGLAQVAAAISVLDYWGRRQSRISGAIVLLGVLISLAIDSLLLLMWLEEREYTRYMLAFMPLWCWSVWAIFVLVREKSWRGVPQPKRFAAGVFASALLTALSLAYSTMYQPTVAPMRFSLKAEFGKAREDRGQPFLQVPLKLSVKNTGEVSVYVIIDDFTVYGRTAKYSEQGTSVEKEWKKGLDEDREDEAERHIDQIAFSSISSGRFYRPGTVLESGQEDTREHVFQIPMNVKYDLLHVDLQIVYMRKDRGRIDVKKFRKPHPSWKKKEGRSYCRRNCPEELVYFGAVRHNNNLVNVTRKPRHVLATWSPKVAPVYSISSYDFRGKGVDFAEESREVDRFGISTIESSSEVSVAELLRSTSSLRPS